ncbi:guanylate kinase [Candidatus Aerophobetes bacterium]|nr:guanylate kinase [Candidatus Aerophobetes bacterium]
MLKKAKGLIVVISAPAGAGKTTLCKRLLQSSPSFINSVSFTTRPARKQEIEGVDYYFISRQYFQKLIEENSFVEWAEVHGHLYGTSKQFLKKNIEAGKDVVLEVDVKGGRKIKEKYSQAITIFILPPSWEELKKRLHKRATENEEEVRRRLATAKEEIQHLPFYDYFLVNDNINAAVKNLLLIIEAQRYKISRVPKCSIDEVIS